MGQHQTIVISAIERQVVHFLRRHHSVDFRRLRLQFHGVFVHHDLLLIRGYAKRKVYLDTVLHVQGDVLPHLDFESGMLYSDAVHAWD